MIGDEVEGEKGKWTSCPLEAQIPLFAFICNYLYVKNVNLTSTKLSIEIILIISRYLKG